MTREALTLEQIQSFTEVGYCLLKSAVATDTCDRIRRSVLQHIALSGESLSTPTTHEIFLDYKLSAGDRRAVLSPSLINAVSQLFAPFSFALPEEIGLAPVRFPLVSGEAVRGRITGWHIDGPDFLHRIDSIEQALVVLVLLTDVDSQTGGTRIRRGSHRTVARSVSSHREGLQCINLISEVLPSTSHLPVDTALGSIGDAILMHGMAVHSGTVNRGGQPRVMLYMRVSWHEKVSVAAGHPISDAMAACLPGSRISRGVSS